MNKKKKIWLLSGIAAVLVIAVGCGVWYYYGHNSSEPVYVYDFQMVGMTEYWGDQKESYGPVRTDRIQNILLSDTQTITEILVQQGDQVKRGDLLMTFDTTLSDLSLERKRLEVEKLKLQLEDDEARLTELRNMRPMVIPNFGSEEEDQGEPLSGDYQIYPQKATETDGSAPEKALLCWIKTGMTVDKETVLEAIRYTAQEYQNINAEIAAQKAWEEAHKAWEEAKNAGQEAGEEPVYVKPDEIQVKDFYVVFKQTGNNMSMGSQSAWQGFHITMDGPTFSFFNADGNKDYSLSEKQNRPQIDYGSGYTAAQLSQMRKDQEKKIRDTQFSIKMAESEYKIMQTEVQDGNIYAKFDGVVASLLPEEEARLSGQPLMKVSGGGGFFIDCSVSELDKQELEIGQTVTVMDYRNGGSYEGTVQSIRDYPSSNGGYYGNGNPNASQYPFTVFVDESANLIEGNYVNVQYSLSSAQNGIYLENPFLRSENGESFVYVLGANGKLEKRDVVTGKGLWGSYTEIREGLSREDKVAFPYGKNVKPGAAAVVGDYSNLYE